MHLRTGLTAIAVFLVTTIAAAAPAPGPAVLRLWRLDCGQLQVNDLNDFSDTFAFTGRSMRLVDSCYLIQHGETYMLWDTGLPEDSHGDDTLSVTIIAQLKQLGVAPGAISLVGISHYHYDHIGQAGRFPNATLLMGRGDVDSPDLKNEPDAAQLDHWTKGPGKLQRVDADKDIFRDGSVIMLDLPGHTPGHHGLLVKLPQMGYVILSGDAAHFRENYVTDGVPLGNADRAQTLASLRRLKEIEKNLHATLVIQHEPQDVRKLPPFPQPAR
jgi:N-acyl homoserine lactone hydrolase